jgi:uncharacterized protein YjdB
LRNKKAVLLLTFIIIMALLSCGCLFNLRLVIDAISDQIGKVGQEFTYQVIAHDPDNGELELTYSLTETEKPEGMQIGSSTGLITWTPEENQIGTFTVEVKVGNGNSFNVKQFKITIADIFLTSIEVSPVTMSIYVGNSQTITSVTAYYDNDTNDNITPLSSYVSDKPNIATVSGSGVITGVSAGSATITVSYTKGVVTKNNTVDVTVPSLTSIEVSPPTMSIIVGNYKDIISITAHYDDGSNTPIGGLDLASYSSNHTSIASVSTTGRVTGVSAGSATITVSYTEGGAPQTDTVVVTVSPAPKVLTSIDVLPATMSIVVGNYKDIISITAHYDDETTADIELVSADVSYSSSNLGIATVNTTGRVTGVSVGGATITVSYTEGGAAPQTATVVVTVSSAPKILTSITVDPSSMSIKKGSSKSITSVTAHYNNSPDAYISLSACTYVSDKANVTVANGLISVSATCAAKTAIITVSYTDGVTKIGTVNVTITGG